MHPRVRTIVALPATCSEAPLRPEVCLVESLEGTEVVVLVYVDDLCFQVFRLGDAAALVEAFQDASEALRGAGGRQRRRTPDAAA